MQETKIPWGRTPEKDYQICVAEYNYPVFFNFPAGHIADNRAFYIGKRAKIEVEKGEAILSYI